MNALYDIVAVAAILSGVSGLVAIFRWDKRARATIRDLEHRMQEENAL